jgi:serine/threonine protein kinase/tetratricopeptide (TPR) repeat protein
MESTSKSSAPKKVCLSCAKEYSSEMVICPDDDTLLTPLMVDTLIGTTLADKYEILEKLGSGGMGLVYKARHLFMKRLVAIKLMLPQYASSAIALKRFRQEAQAASHLNHPNILKVYDFGVTPTGLPYLVMDLLEGTNLSAELEQHSRMDLPRALNIFIQTCSALAHAHQKGVIHRDLKPGNIMLIEYEGAGDVVQIVDFGMAKITEAIDGEKSDLTKTGEVFGSPMYMSPEQCMGKELDARSDIYSLGCVMYRTLTGSPAVSGQTAMECFNKHATTMPAAFSEVASELNLPASIEAVVFKSMAKEPEHRYASMNDLKEALAKEMTALGMEVNFSVPPGTVRPERSPEAALPPTAGPTLADSGQVKVQTTSQGQAPDQAPVQTPVQAGEQSHPHATPPTAPPHEASISIMPPGSKASKRGTIWASIIGITIVGGALFFTFGPKTKTAGDSSGAGPGATTNPTGFDGLIQSGKAAYNHGDYAEAENKFKLALQAAKDSGDYDKNVPEALRWLGNAYFETQDYANATAQYKELLQIRESGKKLTAPDASDAMNSLGDIYLAQKQYPQAEQFFNKALAIRKTYTGADHAIMAESLASLGNLALEKGQFKKATELLTQAEKIADSGQMDETDKAKIYNALGQTYQFQRKMDKAESYYHKALAIREQHLNPDNPAIADTLTCLGTLEFSKRNSAESETLLKRALDIQKRALGGDNPSVAETEFCLGVLYRAQRQIDKAQPLIADALRIRTKVYGAQDPETVQTKQLLDSLKGK